MKKRKERKSTRKIIYKINRCFWLIYLKILKSSRYKNNFILKINYKKIISRNSNNKIISIRSKPKVKYHLSLKQIIISVHPILLLNLKIFLPSDRLIYLVQCQVLIAIICLHRKLLLPVNFLVLQTVFPQRKNIN